jgi:hypothetical protein
MQRLQNLDRGAYDRDRGGCILYVLDRNFLARWRQGRDTYIQMKSTRVRMDGDCAWSKEKDCVEK